MNVHPIFQPWFHDAPDSNDALDRAVSRVEEVALPRAFMAKW